MRIQSIQIIQLFQSINQSRREETHRYTAVAAAELGRNPVSKHQIQPEYGDEQADAGRAAEPVLRDQIFRRERGQGNIHFSCSADHVQDWQPYPVDPYFCYMCDHTCT